MPTQLAVNDGGAGRLSKTKADAIAVISSLIRGLPEEQVGSLVGLIDEFERDHYIRRVRVEDIRVVKILAEAISGWDQDGVYEFACVWASTLVARQDD